MGSALENVWAHWKLPVRLQGPSLETLSSVPALSILGCEAGEAVWGGTIGRSFEQTWAFLKSCTWWKNGSSFGLILKSQILLYILGCLHLPKPGFWCGPSLILGSCSLTSVQGAVNQTCQFVVFGEDNQKHLHVSADFTLSPVLTLGLVKSCS